MKAVNNKTGVSYPISQKDADTIKKGPLKRAFTIVPDAPTPPEVKEVVKQEKVKANSGEEKASAKKEEEKVVDKAV